MEEGKRAGYSEKALKQADLEATIDTFGQDQFDPNDVEHGLHDDLTPEDENFYRRMSREFFAQQKAKHG